MVHIQTLSHRWIINMELTVEELEQKLEQQTQDYHFDMRNKQMEIVMLQARYDDLERENKELRKHQLELVMENGELKDMVLDLGCDYEKHLNKSIDISQLDLFDVSE